MPEKPQTTQKSHYLAKDALKIIDGHEGEGGPEKAKELKEEIEQREKTRLEAEEKGWKIILDHAESRLKELKLANSDLEAAKGTKKVIGARVSLVNTHEMKTKALEAKCVAAA